MNFDNLYVNYLTEFTVADAGIAGAGDFEYNSGDTYAPGDARVPKILGKIIRRKKKRKKKLNEASSIEVYRGTTKHGNKNLGTQSKSIQDKLVGALGPNYTDSQDIGLIFKRGAGPEGQLLKKNVTGKILEVEDYNGIIRLYGQYQKLMTPGIVNLIKSNSGSEQLKYIQLAGVELRDILKSNGYSWVKAPFAVSDAAYFKQKGFDGYIYIDLE